jgi:DNA-binding PadR family transcriptional regulator
VIAARFINSADRPAATSANTFVTICASTMRVPASRATRASVPAAASAPVAASSSDSIPVAGSASAPAVRAAVAAAGEVIQEIAERSQNLWRPSPGSVYPTLQLLVDEGLLVARESEGSKKLFELTDDGRAAADKIETPPWQEIADGWKNEEPGHANLRSAVTQLMGAVAQSAYTSNDEQQERIVDIVNNARREIYQILGESE